MQSIPSGLTRLKINLPNVCSEVATALHELVAQTTTLVDLDAMVQCAPNLNVLQLNGTEEVESMDLSSKSLGPLLGAIIAACIQRNAVLKSLKCEHHHLFGPQPAPLSLGQVPRACHQDTNPCQSWIFLLSTLHLTHQHSMHTMFTSTPCCACFPVSAR